MKRWWFRRKVEKVRAEAQKDLREGLADVVQELERRLAANEVQVAKLTAALSVSVTTTWMAQAALRERATALESTVEVPARSIHTPRTATRRKAVR